MITFYRIAATCAALFVAFVVLGNSSPANVMGSSLMHVGFNWVPDLTPPGESPASALARFGGDVYGDYGDPFIGSEGPERIRLVRGYRGATLGMCNGVLTPVAHGRCPAQISAAVAGLPGRTWGISNEPNINQDATLLSQSDAPAFSEWYNTIRAAIKAGDASAMIEGPAFWNWDGGGNPCACVRGSDAWQWFIQAHLARYGIPPQMDRMAIHAYPYDVTFQQTEAQFRAQIDGPAVVAASLGVPLAVSEWGLRRRDWYSTTCNLLPQSDAQRYAYVTSSLNYMASKGVQHSLYFASHDQVCDSNGFMGWLINQDGSLSPDGRAHRDFVLGQLQPSDTPVLPPTPTAVPTWTLTPQNTPTAALTATLSNTPTASPTRCGTVLTLCTATPTHRPCVQTYIRRCL